MRDQDFEELKAAIVRDRDSGRGPFSANLRIRLIEHVKLATAGGSSVEKVSRELGLCSKTVHSWLGAKHESGLRQVELISERPTQASGRLSMRGPSGTCVEGLKVDDVVAIWRALGC